MDVVYILGRGSIWDNNEIRYSLRSIDKHLDLFGNGNVFIVGELPKWGIKNITRIPAGDIFPCKERNIMYKIWVACQTSAISENFVFMNDDHFLLKNVQGIPYYHMGDIKDALPSKNPKMPYTQALTNTVEILNRYGYPTIHYDSHYPMIINKVKFIRVYERFLAHWTEFPKGFTVKSLYCNMVGVKGVKAPDCKISKFMDRDSILDYLKSREWFSVADIALNDHLFRIFKELYPKQSRYERPIN